MLASASLSPLIHWLGAAGDSNSSSCFHLPVVVSSLEVTCLKPRDWREACFTADCARVGVCGWICMSLRNAAMENLVLQGLAAVACRQRLDNLAGCLATLVTIAALRVQGEDGAESHWELHHHVDDWQRCDSRCGRRQKARWCPQTRTCLSCVTMCLSHINSLSYRKQVFSRINTRLGRNCLP